MPEYKYLGRLNIDTNTLPVKAVVSSLDKRLQPQQHDLLKFHPKHFQLGDIRNLPASQFQNCFIYMAMITAKSYSSCENALLDETKTAKKKALPRVFFRVYDKILPWYTSAIVIFPTLLSICNFMGLLPKGHLIIGLAYTGIIVILALGISLVIQMCWKWFIRCRCPLPETNAFEVVKETTQNELLKDVRETFDEFCKQRVVLLIGIDNINNDFWDNEFKQRNLRNQIAKQNGNEIEDVWLIKDVIPFKDIIKSIRRKFLEKLFLIPVILPAKYITPPPPSPPNGKIGERIKKNLAAGFFKYAKDVWLTVWPKMAAESVAMSFRIIRSSPKVQLVINKSCEIRHKMEMDLCDFEKIALKTIKYYCGMSINIFVCYDYPQEKRLKDKLNHDMRTLKGFARRCNIYKTIPHKPSSDVSNAINKSDIVIVLWGDKTQFSGTIEKEFSLARQKKKPIILLDGRSNPMVLLDSSLTEGCKYVRWNNAFDIDNAL